MYRGFFNLSKKPFDLVPDSEFLYLSRSHRKALTYPDYGIREGAGFILPTGGAGSGQRISVNCHLKALTPGEMEEYIVYRMTVAGNGRAVCFPSDTLELIQHHSTGIPRLVNILCDFLLLTAFSGSAKTVSPDMARDVMLDLLTDNVEWGSNGTGETMERKNLTDRVGQSQAGTAGVPAKRLPARRKQSCAAFLRLRREFDAHLVECAGSFAKRGITESG